MNAIAQTHCVRCETRFTNVELLEKRTVSVGGDARLCEVCVHACCALWRQMCVSKGGPIDMRCTAAGSIGGLYARHNHAETVARGVSVDGTCQENCEVEVRGPSTPENLEPDFHPCAHQCAAVHPHKGKHFCEDHKGMRQLPDRGGGGGGSGRLVPTCKCGHALGQHNTVSLLVAPPLKRTECVGDDGECPCTKFVDGRQ